MSELQHAMSFRDLVVHQKARRVAQIIFELSKSFPREELYSLTDQIRRAARSIGAQIAEAWGKRRFERHFISKLTDADAEQLETQHWTDTAFDCGYLTEKQAGELLEHLCEIGRMLNSMISKSDQFCGIPPLTESHTTDY
jgi:four helix bundle protein